MRIDILTLFPEMFQSVFEASILNQIAINNNAVIWGTGDISQEGYTVTSLEGKDYVLDDDGFLGLNAPALKSIYRLANSAQQNNVRVLKKLEELTIDIKRPDISLEDALKDFEQGISLAKGMETQLDQIEGKIQILMTEPVPMEKDNPPQMDLFSDDSELNGTRK